MPKSIHRALTHPSLQQDRYHIPGCFLLLRHRSTYTTGRGGSKGGSRGGEERWAKGDQRGGGKENLHHTKILQAYRTSPECRTVIHLLRHLPPALEYTSLNSIIAGLKLAIDIWRFKNTMRSFCPFVSHIRSTKLNNTSLITLLGRQLRYNIVDQVSCYVIPKSKRILPGHPGLVRTRRKWRPSQQKGRD